MKPDYTHITVILDRSGSMESIREDTIGGANAFLADQKQQPGEATLTLVQFDNQDPYEVIHQFAPLAQVPALTRETYVPRGGTPLLDALGRGINDVEKQVADLPEDARPAKILVAVVTDGAENASHEFRKEQIVKMIGQKRDGGSWDFAFLSADLDAINEAGALGVDVSSRLSYAKDKAGVSAAWDSLSRYASEYRIAPKRRIGFGPGKGAEAEKPTDGEGGSGA